MICLLTPSDASRGPITAILALLVTFVTLSVAACSGDGPTEPATDPTVIEGVVATATGMTYPGVEVTLRQADAALRTQETDTKGSYAFNDIPPGGYTIVVDPPHFSKSAASTPPAVTVDLGMTAQVDIEVQPVGVAGEINGVDFQEPNRSLANSSGEVLAQPDELVYRRVEHPVRVYPVLHPDGRHLTLSEWSTASGTATATCDGAIGTHVSMTYGGLVPGGRYSAWVSLFDVVETTRPPQFVASGVLGRADGSENRFTASVSGEGQLEVTMPSGPMSLSGTASPCLLTQADFVLLILTYHLADPLVENDPSTWVNHMIFGERP